MTGTTAWMKTVCLWVDVFMHAMETETVKLIVMINFENDNSNALAR